MNNPSDVFTKNKFIDKLLSIIPEDPLTQTQYLYYLTVIVFFGLIGFAVATWYEVFVHFSFTTFFRGIFMTAIAFLSLFGVKQTRQAYTVTKSMMSAVKKEEPDEIESVDEMIKEFGELDQKSR